MAFAPVLAAVTAVVVLVTEIDWAWVWVVALFALPLGLVSLLPGMIAVSMRRRRTAKAGALRR